MEQQDWTNAVKARANRLIAGKPCAACSKAFLLGDEVVTCPQCGGVSHDICWARQNGCAACAQAAGPAPVPPLNPAPAASAPAASAEFTRCRMCAEAIPADTVECPYCGELIDDEQETSLPRSFVVTAGSLIPDEVVLRIAGSRLNLVTAGGDVWASAVRESVILKKRKLIVMFDGRKYKYRINDIGWVIVNHWLTGEHVRRTSVAAKDALWTAIALAILLSILGPVLGVFYAVKALRAIWPHREHVKGAGYAIAAIALSVVVFAGWIVLMIYS